jgi:DNA repair exonuclease SbcCD ATPase subunit
LEDEVRHLAEKANTASQRFADYENEIRVLQAKLRQEQRKKSAVETIAEDGEKSGTTPPAAAEQRPGISRFGSFMGSRNKTPATQKQQQQQEQQNGPVAAAAAAAAAGREKELEEKLVQEQTTRIAAEKRVKEVNAEIEDLSATLFQQANEMVASERKENSELKDKIKELELQQQEQLEQQQRLGEGVAKASDQLEKENEKLKEKIKALEKRDSERKRRLEKLEAASKRIERVKAMLAPP